MAGHISVVVDERHAATGRRRSDPKSAKIHAHMPSYLFPLPQPLDCVIVDRSRISNDRLVRYFCTQRRNPARRIVAPIEEILGLKFVP